MDPPGGRWRVGPGHKTHQRLAPAGRALRGPSVGYCSEQGKGPS